MRITFRTKLLGIVGATALAFVLLIITNLIISNRVKSQLAEIEQTFLPKLELGPHLQGKFEQLQRNFQDAVASQDKEALSATLKLKDSLLKEIRESNQAVDPTDAEELQKSLEEYYVAALDVSQRLIKGETGEGLVKLIANMQTHQNRAVETLKKSASFDREDLSEAFLAVRNAQVVATQLRFAIALLCFTAVLILSLLLSRSVLRSLSDLESGFQRYGKGNFGQPIPISSNDELGDAAQEANKMAARIDGLLEELKNTGSALVAANKELEAFSYSVAHDLRAPIRSMIGFSNALIEDFNDVLPEGAKDSLLRVASSAKKMGELIDGLLTLSRLTRKEVAKEPVNLSSLANEIVEDLQRTDPNRKINMKIETDVTAKGDSQLLQAVLTNLLGNAWKFSRKKQEALIEFGKVQQNGHQAFYVRDNGAGFDMRYSDKLFGTFQRLHSNSEFEGTGIGLATVQRIIHRHGGEIWAESEPEKGSTFYFTLG